jgi:O-6-methylguanine DNA methyltransferase
MQFSQSIYSSPIGDLIVVCEMPTVTQSRQMAPVTQTAAQTTGTMPIVHLVLWQDMPCHKDSLNKWKSMIAKQNSKVINAPLNPLIATRLDAYFAKESLDAIKDIPLYEPPFDERKAFVLRELRRVPVGTTTTYLALSKKIGSDNLSRYIGSVNRLNHINILYPCHRVLKSDGKISGYAGGVERKRWLLRLEGVEI